MSVVAPRPVKPFCLSPTRAASSSSLSSLQLQSTKLDDALPEHRAAAEILTIFGLASCPDNLCETSPHARASAAASVEVPLRRSSESISSVLFPLNRGSPEKRATVLRRPDAACELDLLRFSPVK
jgi:hypothetical protein